MKRLIIIIILVFAFLISMSCKKEKQEKQEKIEKEITKKELVQCDGYRDVKWGMTLEEVKEVFLARGLKEGKGGQGARFDVMYETFIILEEKILEMNALLKYQFGESGLRRVIICFDDYYRRYSDKFDIDEIKANFKEIEMILDDKYKNRLAKQNDIIHWETTNTVISLHLEMDASYSYTYFVDIEGDLIILAYSEKEYYYKILGDIAVKEIKKLLKKQKDKKEKF